MTMTPEQARAVQRAPVLPGDRLLFFCEVQEDYEPPEKRLRRFTGQHVNVVRNLDRTEYDGPGPDDNDDDEFETSRMFAVRAEDGTEFHAHVEELNGWDYDLGQFFWPDGTYGPDHDTRFLVNEPDLVTTGTRAVLDALQPQEWWHTDAPNVIVVSLDGDTALRLTIDPATLPAESPYDTGDNRYEP